MTRFEVYVAPRSARPGPAGRHDGVPRLRVTSPPSDGRANAEAEKRLSEILGAPVRLVGGSRWKRKTFDTELAAADLDARLVALFHE